MKKNFTRFFVSIILFTLLGIAASPRASGQSAVYVSPSTLHRYIVSYFDGGHLLTGFTQEGVANNYIYDPIPDYDLAGFVGMYVPPAGYTPAPAAGLVPLHRWTVIQDGWRTHYYYSTYYSEQPSDRYYNGIAGYVFPPGTIQHQFTGVDGNGRASFTASLRQLSVWYSQDLGFFNGYSAPGYSLFFEGPPNHAGASEYEYQGVIAALPPSQMNLPAPYALPVSNFYNVLFFPPGGGGGGGGQNTGDCNPSSGTVNACHHNGGEWDYGTCTCQY